MSKQEYIEKLKKGTARLSFSIPEEDQKRDFNELENIIATQIAKDFKSGTNIEGLEVLNYAKRVKYRCKLWVDKLNRRMKKENVNLNKLKGLVVFIHNLEDKQVKNVVKNLPG